MQIVEAFPSMLKVFRLLRVFILWLATLVVHALKPQKAPLLQGLESDLVCSMTESFSWPCIKNMTSITTG